MIDKLARLEKVTQQIELASALEAWHPTLTEHAFSWSLGWPAELGLGIDVRYRAICICEVDECQRYTLRVDEPLGAWSWESLLDGLVDVGRLPFNGVVYGLEQAKRELFEAAAAKLFVRYHQPLPRR